ncbi:Uncharacterised protein [Candidatus Bartonella washoeensis]|uniref:Lipoprotein n=1 Tax=Candidatus Bartonella washoeensis Sb944nv TaxID=1094563 RepID=J0YVM1_9HYPH|nr:EexN family lipoprotein [Bartonella washoeensis]EJF79143.1 hypothetical protein MCQ_00684 [Bartonella washoeensis Sb944nv]SPU26787.1 Uncharacterised protein [Bartonella washoeensis]
MKKFILLCTAVLFVAGCEKIYSVEELKKDEKLREEWGKKCFFGNAVQSSKNCQNILQADTEMFFSQKPVHKDPGHAF